MITLGLNAAFHDSSAALVVDGVVVAAAEEERFTRIKHGKRPVPFSAWELPFNAIDFCLQQAGVTLADVDHVAYSYDPKTFLGERHAPTITLPLEPSAADHGDWESPWDPLFAAYIVNAPRQLADGWPHHLRKRLSGVKATSAPYRWHFVNHHTCHQASAFLAAPYPRCAVMTLDGRGEHATTTYGRHRDSRYEPMGEVLMPHSLGMLYEQMTTHLGFLHSSDEYKVMALAALGTPRFARRLRDAIHIGADGQYTIDPIDLTAIAGPAREPGSQMAEAHLDLAASLQDVLESVVIELCAWLREASGERYLAMAGGVALNCVMNARLRDSGIFDGIWVQPAAGDAGTGLGAALWVDARERRGLAPTDAKEQAVNTFAPRRWQMDHPYLGPAYGDDEIEQLLKWAKLPYRRCEDLAAETAELLAANRIVGWFQGRMEFGPRSLGARSILASPIDPAMQARLNELKDREDFRPVAPAVPEEELGNWFRPAEANGGQSPFMLFIYDLAPGAAERIPSACHTDRTARVQTVNRDTNPRFHALLKAFGKKTGVPVLVNTSFNVRGEPIVCSPKAAIEAFFSTPLDALSIGSFLVEKPSLQPST
ncbi:carbamoyltransferase [Piscinibacter gummiphilus]|uniref:Carbamoyltransferase C-terminal domain-containing protein n=1 Tax=Piscinibacter gummiphilus TaxID=946333 RepID=A0ABZ0CT49_9BURK|nr:carbamoyltransferase C-terminal domain-containing protein [Piscinibacter gummiphilus]WOB06135.1 carbamoyltransferase C-terminal domain-containing protein [Piscinibacter gummiphilus]